MVLVSSGIEIRGDMLWREGIRPLRVLIIAGERSAVSGLGSDRAGGTHGDGARPSVPSMGQRQRAGSVSLYRSPIYSF